MQDIQHSRPNGGCVQETCDNIMPSVRLAGDVGAAGGAEGAKSRLADMTQLDSFLEGPGKGQPMKLVIKVSEWSEAS